MWEYPVVQDLHVLTPVLKVSVKTAGWGGGGGGKTPKEGGGGGGGEKDSHMKGVGMFVVLLRGVNFGLWSHLGCSGQNAIIQCSWP